MCVTALDDFFDNAYKKRTCRYDRCAFCELYYEGNLFEDTYFAGLYNAHFKVAADGNTDGSNRPYTAAVLGLEVNVCSAGLYCRKFEIAYACIEIDIAGYLDIKAVSVVVPVDTLYRVN